MHALLMAWETTVEDVENVLRRMNEDIALAPELHDKLDHEDIARAALNGDSIEEQAYYAYEEIRRQILENTLI
jgi:membrane carboxypeptidase/penicillin-binding protein